MCDKAKSGETVTVGDRMFVVGGQTYYQHEDNDRVVVT